MPVVSYASVSDSPPMVAVSCAPEGFTCRLAQKARSYSLSLLDRGRLDAFGRLATLSGARERDKLQAAGLAHSDGTRLKVPLIEGSSATLECRLDSVKRTGDHLLLVAKVVASDAAGAFSDFWDYTEYRPVLYAGWRDGMTVYPGT